MNFQIFLQIILNSLLPISVLALATLGIVLIFRTSTTTNFAQGMIATVGTYAATMLTLKAGLNIWLSILIGVVIGFVIGLFIDAVIFRRAKYANPIGKQMITMGVVLLITGLLPIIFTDAFTTPPDGYKFVEGNDWINFYDGQVVMSNHAVVSVITGRSTTTLSISAWHCISILLRLAPPSTLNVFIFIPASFSIQRTISKD